METDRWAGLELRHLLALDAVAREGSFGRAAIALGYTQSAVSQQIAALERMVGERLVERAGGPRPVSLTEAGELLLRHADAIVARLAAAKADLQALSGGEAGTLRIGIYQSVGERILPDVMRRVAADSPLAERTTPPSMREIADLDLIGFRNCRSEQQVENALRRPLRYVFRADQNGTVQGVVGAGVGVALVPRLTVDTTDDRTVVLELGTKVPPRLIALAWHRDRYRTPAAKAFVECAQAVCAPLQREPVAA